MKVVVLQENLNKGLSFVSRSVAARPQLPILANVLLKTEAGKLKLSATNLETGASYWAGAKIEKEGEFTLPARIFAEVVSGLPREKIELVLEESQIRVSCLNTEASFNGIPAGEFPSLPVFPKIPLFSFEKTLLLEAIGKVSFAAATDEGRPVLTGVLLTVNDKEISFAATDGFRLSLLKLNKPKEINIEKEVKILLPAKTLMEVSRAAGELTREKEERILLGLAEGGNQAVFAFGDCQVATQLIGGDYPDYQKIIPQKTEVKIETDKENLTRAVRMAAIFARDSANIIKFKIEKGQLLVSANTPQVGNNKTTIEIRGGEEGEIAFNSKYLMDFLTAVPGDEISMEITGALNPGVFRAKNDKGFLHIIMPVRVQG